MKRRILPFLLILVLIISFTGCSSPAGKTADNEPASAPNETIENMSNLDIDHTDHGKIVSYDGKTITYTNDNGENVVANVSESVVLGKEPPEGRPDGASIGAPPEGSPPPKPDGEKDDPSVITKEGTIVTLGFDKENIVILIEMAYIQDLTNTNSSTEINKSGTISDTKYISEKDIENALAVTSAKVSFDKITVEKIRGNSDDTTDGDTFGYNAAMLVYDKGSANISNSGITSSVTNGNGIFVYGAGSRAEVKDTSIHTTGNYSGGIMVTNDGTIIASNLNIHTEGHHSAPIRSDHGGGIEEVTGGTYTSDGLDSPVIYATHNVNVKDIEGHANQSEILVAVGVANVTLRNSTIFSTKNRTQGNSVTENVQGIMIYNSGPSRTHSQVTLDSNNLTIDVGDTFYITNITTDLTLKNNQFHNNDPSAAFLKVVGNTGSLGWGSAGKNEGNATVKCFDQTIEGNIIVDTISSLRLTLTNSDFTGQITEVANRDATSDAHAKIDLTIEAGSTWTLTGDSYVTSLTNNGTINFNGHTITLADGTVLSE